MNKPAKISTDRSAAIVTSGYLFILTNFLLAFFNAAVGLLSGSLAIISDAAHSLIDAISGLLIIFSEKLSASHKLSAHRARIERVTTIIIALIIIVTGLHIFIESIEKLTNPTEVDYNLPTFIILIASIAAKYALAIYLKRLGKSHRSDVLAASSAETMNDTLISIAVFVSAITYLIWQIDIEAYISIFISIIIFKVGLEFIFPHISRHHHHPLEQDPDHDHCHKTSTKS